MILELALLLTGGFEFQLIKVADRAIRQMI